VSVRTCRLVAAGLLGACATVGAPGPVVPDRPGYTDTPTALPAGALQLETGVTDDRTSGGPGTPATDYRSFGEVLVRAGIGARTELRLFANSYAVRTADRTPKVSGMEDAKFGAKFSLRAAPDSVHGWLPNAALLAATTLATGTIGLSAGAAQPEAKLAINWSTPSPFSLYANIGAATIYTNSGRASRAWTSVAAWWAVNSRVSAFAEGIGFGRLSGSGNGTAGNDVDAGLTLLVTDRFQLDVRAGRGLGSETSNERFIGAGLARRW
jgi:hypothetical protein